MLLETGSPTKCQTTALTTSPPGRDRRLSWAESDPYRGRPTLIDLSEVSWLTPFDVVAIVSLQARLRIEDRHAELTLPRTPAMREYLAAARGPLRAKLFVPLLALKPDGSGGVELEGSRACAGRGGWGQGSDVHSPLVPLPLAPSGPILAP